MAVKGIESWGFKLCPTKDKEIFDYKSIICSENKMRGYLIFPGVYIIYIDFKEKYMAENSFENGNYGYRIAYSYEGNYFTYINNSKVLINRQLFIGKYIPNSKQSYTNRDRTTAFNIVISPNNLDESIFYYDIINNFLDSYKNVRDIGCILSSPKALNTADELILSLKEEDKLLISLKTLELIYLISKGKVYDNRLKYYQQSEDDKIILIEKYFRENLSANINLDLICDKFSISKTNLNTKFIRKYQHTPMKYLNNLRMIKAQEFLINTDNDIIQISNVLGYTDPSNFTRSFKKYTGLCPSKYRNLNRK